MSKSINALFTSQNIRLFNLLFRHQVYLEGVKSAFANDYVAMLNELYVTFGTFLHQSRYQQLDAFTRTQLALFINKFRQAQIRFYSRWTQDLITSLQEFVAADVEVTTAIFQDVTGKTPEQGAVLLPKNISASDYAALDSTFQDEYAAFGSGYTLTPLAIEYQKAKGSADDLDGSADANKQLWAGIIAEPMPANGEFVEDSINKFSEQALFAVLALIYKGSQNNWTTQQLADAMVGSTDAVFGGLFSVLINQSSSVMNTILQHVSISVQTAIASVFYEQFQWVAILDNVTTPICRERNGLLFRYDTGPFPPAHYNCRSKAVAWHGDETTPIPTSYFEWLKSQPEEVQNNILGKALASKLRSGDLNSDSLGGVSSQNPLTLEQFKGKIKYILEA